MNKPVPQSRPRLSAPQFRDQWRKANDEINQLIALGVKLKTIMPGIYEGVLGEAVPDAEDGFDIEDAG